MTPALLAVVSGAPGSGKTTLAHEIASQLGCPVICRDEIKQGMVQNTTGYTPSPSDAANKATYTVFFDVLTLLLRAGVTVVAEAAFQDHAWRPALTPLADIADIRIIRCATDHSTALARIAARAATDAQRAAHDDQALLTPAGTQRLASFDPVHLAGMPTLDVDTTDGYDPCLVDILAFLRQACR